MLLKNMNEKGFTLIELIFVIAIIAIASVVVVPRWNASSQRLEYEARRVLNDVRYAQAMSMLTGQRYRFVRASSTSYQITDEDGVAVLLPRGSSTMVLTSGVTFGTFSNLPSNLVVFNSLGVPYTTTAIPGAALASTASIPLVSGSQTRTINISPETGFAVLS